MLGAEYIVLSVWYIILSDMCGVSNAGYIPLSAGYSVANAGYILLGARYSVLSAGYILLSAGCSVLCSSLQRCPKVRESKVQGGSRALLY